MTKSAVHRSVYKVANMENPDLKDFRLAALSFFGLCNFDESIASQLRSISGVISQDHSSLLPVSDLVLKIAGHELDPEEAYSSQSCSMFLVPRW